MIGLAQPTPATPVRLLVAAAAAPDTAVPCPVLHPVSEVFEVPVRKFQPAISFGFRSGWLGSAPESIMAIGTLAKPSDKAPGIGRLNLGQMPLRSKIRIVRSRGCVRDEITLDERKKTGVSKARRPWHPELDLGHPEPERRCHRSCGAPSRRLRPDLIDRRFGGAHLQASPTACPVHALPPRLARARSWRPSKTERQQRAGVFVIFQIIRTDVSLKKSFCCSDLECGARGAWPINTARSPSS